VSAPRSASGSTAKGGPVMWMWRAPRRPSSGPCCACASSSGGADPATPPRHGERVARLLGPKALHQVVPAAGHGVINLPCMRDVVARFIEAKSEAEALALKTDCAKDMPRALAFVPPNPLLPPLPKKNPEGSK